ncbi:MAG: Hsp20/alpha crystallin family protein [Thermogutta sp.]|uniref:Hsp20/alpha crystallin family protein n=1 Tax=Thermogutta sp. TaxID=1962930 RepID=UPI001996B78A|nr:Hsp20/alpha crystallin family protein [Thermogutta sp.]MBC7352993.1 Hsp20/alpha crystallin family protein [Thermogutta sp.]GIX02405.1 MAG: molecular chaperone Hsp20 [Thermogutta sp.]
MTRTLVPWTASPTRLFESLRREMNELMDQFFGGENGTELGLWFAPRVNVAETDTAFEVSVDLPGMKPEDFSVELKEGHLWITGERRQETEEKGKTYHRVERQYGRFQRVIPLPAAVNPDKIEAEYKDGVLRITLPKDESAQPKRIPVKT